jgi:hypothetical protein
MTIPPITPSSITGAAPYAVPLAAYTSDLSEKPINPQTGKPQKGANYVPMQFNFASYPAWSVDLSAVSSIKPFTQCASMYVDTLNSTHDVTILFPDTGWQTRVPFGATAMINPLTTKKIPFFYVILDSGNSTNASDIVNVYAIDTFIPPSFTSNYQRSVNYGYSSMFSLTPEFTQSTAFYGFQNSTGGTFTIINHTQWYITGITGSLQGFSNGTDSGGYTVSINDAGTTFILYQISWVTTGALIIPPSGGLNYISSGNGPCTYTITGSGVVNGFIMGLTLFGGVLVN